MNHKPDEEHGLKNVYVRRVSVAPDTDEVRSIHAAVARHDRPKGRRIAAPPGQERPACATPKTCTGTSSKPG